MNRVVESKGDENLGRTARFAEKAKQRRFAKFLVKISNEIDTQDAGGKSRKGCYLLHISRKILTMAIVIMILTRMYREYLVQS